MTSKYIVFNYDGAFIGEFNYWREATEIGGSYIYSKIRRNWFLVTEPSKSFTYINAMVLDVSQVPDEVQLMNLLLNL